MTIREICYELYKADWLRNHLPDLDTGEFLNEFIDDGAGCSISDWLWEQGFGGELYVCFDEFVGAEYQMKSYILFLLGDHEELVEQYVADLDEDFDGGEDDDDSGDENDDFDNDDGYGDDDYADEVGREENNAYD